MSEFEPADDMAADFRDQMRDGVPASFSAPAETIEVDVSGCRGFLRGVLSVRPDWRLYESDWQARASEYRDWTEEDAALAAGFVDDLRAGAVICVSSKGEGLRYLMATAHFAAQQIMGSPADVLALMGVARRADDLCVMYGLIAD
jgi:hypothetical protein